MGLKSTFLASLLVITAVQGLAQTPDRQIGGDIIRLGESRFPVQAPRDVLVSGATVSLDGTVAQDVHAAGFDVTVDATTGGDLYAFGFSVNLQGPIGSDLTASGFSVKTGSGAQVAGNARLAGARVMIDGPVKGTLMAAGGRVTLNSEVSGDVLLTAETLNFGPDAQILGTLTYSSPTRIDIPERVLPADRITFKPYERSAMMRDAKEMWPEWEYPVMPTFFAKFVGFLVTLGFFILIGALFLTLAPVQVRHLRRTIDAKPGMALVSGVLGLSVLFGLVPVSLFSVVGIPLVPIVVLAVVMFWIFGYILGAYVLAMRLMRGLGGPQNPEIWMRLLALVIGVTIMALLNFIPVLGWMANFALVLLGIGGMSAALFERMTGKVAPALDADGRTSEDQPE